MKLLVIGTLTLLLGAGAQAQEIKITGNEWKSPHTGSVGRAPLRTEFISYDIREEADQGNIGKCPFFLPLNMFSTTRNGQPQLRAVATIPYMWLDRDLFLHVEGVPDFYVSVNDQRIGYSQDSRTPSEFNISKYVKDGQNTLAVEIMSEGVGNELETALKEPAQPFVFLYSQPKARIEDYRISARPDSTGKYGVLNLQIALSNSYNTPETITVGYDIYSPKGKLQYFDMKEAKLQGQGRDTVEFTEAIYGVMDSLWSAEKPYLYRGMLTVKRDGRMVEYIPFKIGFGTTEVQNGVILRNGQPLQIKAARYDAAPDAATTEEQLRELKKRGINTVWGNYPQPMWFYALCDRIGMYVIDQANLNSDFETGNPDVGGTLSNNPAWLGSFEERVSSMQARTKNHTCVIALSLGGSIGNGYNMQKCYQLLKQTETERAILFNDARGEWNSDLEPIEAEKASAILNRP